MNNWRHLFLTGEFAPRAHILSGLTLEQVSTRPTGAPHSIFEELWHAAEWQRLTLERDEAALERWEGGVQFPPRPAPEDEAVWQALVRSFLSDSERAVRLSQNEAWLESDETELSGFTWGNALECLVVHSAYHMGKIVLLRQLLGVWSPPPENAEAP
ncbi:MAG: hypothetical protein AVDCRST_MAG86-3744 [uncultured Truepera sp.]|uniref:DinB-like domain-containing protein n=1 Tax=uncultured Truepera sp. TaxID=543023 RepID=A0A6J4VQ44_9DEIN|nr:MAG: hypothetical protein AVDCRST_MAG86-3744 [uncultured Truepera sp.]